MKIFNFFITISAMVVIPVSLIAQEIKLLEIKPVPALHSGSEAPFTRSIGEYDGSGIIDAVYGERIVINDQNFSFSMGMAITTTSGEKKEISELTPGVKAYYFLESTGKIKALVLKRKR